MLANRQGPLYAHPHIGRRAGWYSIRRVRVGYNVVVASLEQPYQRVGREIGVAGVCYLDVK